MFRHKTKFARATLYTIVALAAIHLALSLFAAIYYGQPDYANFFHILGFDLIFKSLGSGAFKGLVAAAFVLALWYSVSLVLHVHDRNNAATEQPTDRQ